MWVMVWHWTGSKLAMTGHQNSSKGQWVKGLYSSWASYQIRKIAGCACAGNAGNGFPRRRFQRKLLVSDPSMHHGTCVTHVPWCMPGLPTCGDGENVPGIPGACAPAILRIWQEAHGITSSTYTKLIHKQLETHGCVLSTVASDATSQQNPVLTIYSLHWTSFRQNITFIVNNFRKQT